MDLIPKLKKNWENADHPFLIHGNKSLYFSDIESHFDKSLEQIKSGDVVALIGDFEPQSISNLLRLFDKNVIVAPLTTDTHSQHDYFFKAASVDVIIKDNNIKRIDNPKKNILLEKLKKKNHPGLILFSTGTTGRPKAILHDFSFFLKKYEVPRPTLRTINFLLFDHIGGINTLFHTLFNKGTVIAPKSRNVEDILNICKKHQVEVLPTTPTFLRMMLMSGLVPHKIPNSLKIITYGTERMDQITLDELCNLLPNIDFRQTYGMSELGIVRVKSKARNSLFMKIGGDGIETKIVNDILYIRSINKMMGYLNADNPFLEGDWYNTNDIVEKSGDFFKITGRVSEVINVGGLKFMASEVERVALEFQGVELAKVEGKNNPITGQHVEIQIQPKKNHEIDKIKLKLFLSSILPSHMVPKRLKVSSINIGHRFKKI